MKTADIVIWVIFTAVLVVFDAPFWAVVTLPWSTVAAIKYLSNGQ